MGGWHYGFYLIIVVKKLTRIHKQTHSAAPNKKDTTPSVCSHIGQALSLSRGVYC
jgi:hypothetical protein